MKNIVLLLGLLSIVIGCGPELTLQGSKVEVGKESEIKRCQLLGSTRLSLTPVYMKLAKKGAMKEYQVLEARNFAARIGGNMILPVGVIEEGKQSFKIFICPIFND